jgi:hypothetical protein
MAKLDDSRLGNSALGTSKFGPVKQTPDELQATNTPRDRFDNWVKSAFPTEDGTVWNDLLNTLAGEFNSQLSVRQNLWLQQYVDTATDAQLERVGEGLFNLPRRGGESDPHYRSRIKLQLPKYTGGATINEILSVSSHILDCDPEQLELVESPDTEPARFDLFINEQTVTRAGVSVDEFTGLLQEVKAAGVRARATIGAQFTYRSEYEFNNNINDADRGYGSADGNVEGAPYADIITAEHRSGDEAVDTTVGLVGFGEGDFGSDGFGK